MNDTERERRDRWAKRNIANGRKCGVCGSVEFELRPYGKNGTDVCYSCGTSVTHVRETEAQMKGRMDAAGPVAVVGDDRGVRAPSADEYRRIRPRHHPAKK